MADLGCTGYWFLPPLSIVQRTFHVTFGLSALLQNSNNNNNKKTKCIHLLFVSSAPSSVLTYDETHLAAASPVYPLRHFIDHYSAAPGQQVPLSGYLTA